MSADGRIVMDTTELDRIMSRLGINNEQMVRAIALDIEGDAKLNCPVDTGALRSSIFTKTATFDDTNWGNEDTEPLPNPPENVAYVGPTVSYAEYVELGTSRQAAQPFLTPAAMAVSEKYNSGAVWEGLIK